jgi:hypothetical protein
MSSGIDSPRKDAEVREKYITAVEDLADELGMLLINFYLDPNQVLDTIQKMRYTMNLIEDYINART